MTGLQTKTGQPLTEEMIEAMAREAEAGYDPATLRPRRGGRPSLAEGTSPRVQFRVDPATFEALLARARAEARGVSEIARLALEQYLRDDRGVSEPAHPVAARAATTPRSE